MAQCGSERAREQLCLRKCQHGWKKWPRLAINKKRRKLFAEALSQIGLGLEDRMGTQVGTLSGGQRQALALVMATISTPSILLLDEHPLYLFIPSFPGCPECG
jgi:putative ABC transport system ATP-binding protein